VREGEHGQADARVPGQVQHLAPGCDDREQHRVAVAQNPHHGALRAALGSHRGHGREDLTVQELACRLVQHHCHRAGSSRLSLAPALPEQGAAARSPRQVADTAVRDSGLRWRFVWHTAAMRSRYGPVPRQAWAALAAAGCLILAACGGGSSSAKPASPKPSTSATAAAEPTSGPAAEAAITAN